MPRIGFILIALSSMLHAGNVNVSWQTPAGSTIQDNSGAALTSDYVFELGGFTGSFDPSSSNTADWAANWKAVGRVQYNAGSNRFDGFAVLDNNNDPFELTDEVYIWGYNLQSPTAEWVLISSNSWSWPDTNNPFVPGNSNYSVTPSGGSNFVVAVGSVNVGGVLIQTASVSNSSPPPLPYDSWVAENFTSTQQQDSNIVGQDEDPDSDGLTNLYEYATGTSPTEENVDTAVSVETVNDASQLFAETSISLSPQAQVIVRLQESTTLTNFVDLNPVEQVIESLPNKLVLRDPVAITPTTPRSFYRIKIDPAP